MPVAVGETFERYEIESLIGRGGMGEVYRAVDTRLRRKVALKVLRPDRDNSEAVARLFREARSAAVLTHPNTVAIHDIGESEGIFYIVMELVTGQSLLAYVGDDRVPAARKLGWLVDVARALGAAHKTGVIHRDVKPSNVMVSDDGIVKVLDFGLAKPLAPVSFRTQAGHVLGTPRYMAPEQLAGAEIDARTDQYAYGLTAYELVAGKHPGGVLAGPVEVPPLDAVVPVVSRAVAEVVARAMATNPDDRFASMEELAVALEDAMAGKVPRGVTAGHPAVGEPSEITAIEMPATEAPITDTVRFAEVAGEPPGAVTTQRAGGAGAAVIARIDVLPVAAVTAEPDPEADRPTLTARTTAGATLLMADAPASIAVPVPVTAPVAAKAPARVAERTLLSADAAAVVGPAPVEKTLLAGGVTPGMERARDSAVRKADAKAGGDADADARANADAKANAKAKAKADEAPLSTLPAGVPARRPAGMKLAGGIVVLGVCAFGGAYYGSKELGRSATATSATAVAETVSARAPASAAASAAPRTSASVPSTTTGTASGTVPTPTPTPTPRRLPRPTAVPSVAPPPPPPLPRDTSSPLDEKNR